MSLIGDAIKKVNQNKQLNRERPRNNKTHLDHPKKPYSNDHYSSKQNNRDPYIDSVSEYSFKMSSLNSITMGLIAFISILSITSGLLIYKHYYLEPINKNGHTHNPPESFISPHVDEPGLKKRTTHTPSHTQATTPIESPTNTTLPFVKSDLINTPKNFPQTKKTPDNYIKSHTSSGNSHPVIVFNPENKDGHHTVSPANVPTLDAEKFYNLRFLEIQEGKLIKALVALHMVAQNQTFYMQTIIHLCESLREKGKFEEAKAVINAGIDNYPNEIPFILQLSSTYLGANEYEQSVQLLEKYTPDFDENPEYYALLAYSYLKVNRLRESVNLYKQLVIFDSTNAPWWIGLGIGYQNKSQRKLALEAFRHALRVSKDQATYKPFLEERITEMTKDQIL